MWKVFHYVCIQDKVELGSLDLACTVQQRGDHDTEENVGKHLETQTDTKREVMNIMGVPSSNPVVQSGNTLVQYGNTVVQCGNTVVQSSNIEVQSSNTKVQSSNKMEHDVPDGESGKDLDLEPNRITVHQEIPKVCFYLDIYY